MVEGGDLIPTYRVLKARGEEKRRLSFGLGRGDLFLWALWPLQHLMHGLPVVVTYSPMVRPESRQ